MPFSKTPFRFIFFFLLLPVMLLAGQPCFQCAPGSDGAITTWLVLGPFSNSAPGVTTIGEHGAGCYGYHNDMLANSGGEEAASPVADQSVLSIASEKRTWQPFFSSSQWIDFNTHFIPNDDVVAYAFAILHVDQDAQVNLGLSHNDGMKIWLNGKQIYAEHPAHVVLNSVIVPVTLIKGDNRLMVKVDEKKGEWGFGLSVKPVQEGQQLNLTIKLPAPNDPRSLQAILFHSGKLQNSALQENEPLVFKFPGAHVILPQKIKLPLILLDSTGKQVDEQTLTLDRRLKASYPLHFKLGKGQYMLALENRADVPGRPLKIVVKSVFNHDPDEHIGQRPYEMGDRPGYRQPLVDFEDLQGWWIHSQNGASARLYRSRAQQMDGHYVAKVLYRGEDGTSAFEFGPPQPVPISKDADNVGVWIYGNNWAWQPDPETPQVAVQIILVDENDAEQIIPTSKVNWKEWFLLWRRFQRTSRNLRFKSIRVLGCANHQERTLYFDSVNFDHEKWQPLKIKPLPDMLPFLTTQETILPLPHDSVLVASRLQDREFISTHVQNNKKMTFRYSPESGTLGDFSVQTNSGQTIQPFVNGDIQFQLPLSAGKESAEGRTLVQVEQKDAVVIYHWLFSRGKIKIPYQIAISARYNSLLIDVAVPGADRAKGLQFGYLKSSTPCKPVRVPMLTYGLPDPQVVCSGDVFVFALLDHYRSHASMLYAANKVLSPQEVQFNGGSRYLPKTDGHRNPLVERIVLTVSPNFQDVLPNIPHPPSPMGSLTRSRLWKENWGMPPDSTAYEKFYQGLKVLRDYGVSQFIVRHHEETWRDGGESFTLRLKAAPKKGGDSALVDYVKRVKDLGFVCGLYTNYIDFAPVNANWSADRVARTPDENFVNAWARCYTLKPILARKFEAEYAPAIHKKYGSNTVYCDVHTAVTPWSRVDYDNRVPEAGMFRAQHKAYALLLNNEKKSYQGPVFSEGLYHWFYAGLTDGNYGQIRDSQPDQVPALVDFDLLRIHPLETDIGMGNPGMFYRAGINQEERTSRSNKFDRFLATTIAYGHNGYLIDIPVINDLQDKKYATAWGIPAIMKSYYMMQQLQSRYALQKAVDIGYFNGKEWLHTSQAIRDDSYLRGQIRTRYEGGLQTIVNLNETEDLTVTLANRKLTLPPNSYAAAAPGFFEFSGFDQGHRVDEVTSPDYLYADGRGALLKTDNISLTNSAVVLKNKGAVWLIPIDEHDQVSFRLGAMGLRDQVHVRGCDEEGKALDEKVVYKIANGWMTVRLNTKVFKYRFDQ